MNNQETAFEKLITVQRMTRAFKHASHEKDRPGMDVAHGRGRVLSMLKLRDGIATKEMAEVLGIRVSSLNETLSRMERDGLIERRPSEADKRVMLIFLTEAGAATDSPRQKIAGTIFAGFSDEELEAFGSYLDRLADNLEAELGEDYREFVKRGRARREQFFREAGPEGRGPGCHGPHGHHGHHGPHGDHEGFGPGKCGPRGGRWEDDEFGPRRGGGRGRKGGPRRGPAGGSPRDFEERHGFGPDFGEDDGWRNERRFRRGPRRGPRR